MKIAITGKMCSGKTTLCNQFVSLEPRFEVFSFGKKIKNMATELFDMNPLKKDRSLLIAIGAKMREIDSEVWINYVLKQTENKEFCIIDDLRYQNEYEALAKHGFLIIQLNISRDLQVKRIKELYPDNYQDHIENINHLSESNQFKWQEDDHIYTLTADDDIVTFSKEILRS
jgi:dephospho-CoA kinase